MPIKRVLTIESVNDSSAQQMLYSIYKKHEYNDFDIDHFFFMDFIEDDKNSDKLFHELSNKIEEFNPDVILIHTGRYFYIYENCFTEILPEIKKNNLKILFGIQNRLYITQKTLNILDNCKRIRKLEDIFFCINR